MKLFLNIACILVFILSYHTDASAQAETSPILFIYDASGSMWGQMDGKTKKEIASDVLSSTITQLPDMQKIGLMAYGHRKKGDCADVELLTGLDNNSKEKVIDAIRKIQPLGRTPLARSATMAIDNLRESKTTATIILVTDGIESCDGDLCEVIAAARDEGIEFKLHIVGFGLKEGESVQLECAAKAGGGQYYDAADAGGLAEVILDATSETVDDPEDNFSLYATKNGLAVDAWVMAYQADTKEEVDAGRSYRDSAFLHLPAGTYDIEIRPLEGTDVSGTTITVNIKEGERKHETISFDGGSLEVSATNNGEGWDAIVKILDRTSGKVVASARTYGRSKTMEVDAGTYDVSFQALAMKGLQTLHKVEQVSIKAGKVINLSHNFETGLAMIGVVTSGGELVDATVNIYEIKTGTSVAGGRTYTAESSNPKKFVLNPGEYTVKILTLGVHKGHKESFAITVKAGETVEKMVKF